MLDTEATCSIINYRIFWEFCQLQHPITTQKNTKVTNAYSRQTFPMIRCATIAFSYDPDGQFIFLLTAWITEMRTQKLLSMGFCQKQISGIHFDLPGREIDNPPESICYGSFHQKNPILIYHKFWQLEPLIQCVLMPTVPVAGNIRLQTLIYTSQQTLLFIQIDKLWLLPCHF